MKKRRYWGFRLAVVLLVLLLLAAGGGYYYVFRYIPSQTLEQADEAAGRYRAGCSADTSPHSEVIGLLELPGASTQWPIQAGVDGDLTIAVGWYEQTARPGEVGNMALVGQRWLVGGPFDRILDLNEGEAVVIETCDMRYTYTIVVAPRDLTIQPEDIWVIDPIPGTSSTFPVEAWLTLIANQDIYPATNDRAVGFASLTASAPR